MLKMKIRIYIITCLLLLSATVFAQVPALERVEPMFWWVGMKNTKLQLIVHGNNIAGRTVKMNYPGVKLVQVHKVAWNELIFGICAPDARKGKEGSRHALCPHLPSPESRHPFNKNTCSIQHSAEQPMSAWTGSG